MKNKFLQQHIVVFAMLAFCHAVFASACLAADSRSGGGASGTGTQVMTKVMASGLVGQAMQMGAGRPMPCMAFTGTAIMKKCTPLSTFPERPWPAKLEPDTTFPISKENHDVPKPPHMSGLNGPSGPGGKPVAQAAQRQIKYSEPQKADPRPESKWSPTGNHITPGSNKNFIQQTHEIITSKFKPQPPRPSAKIPVNPQSQDPKARLNLQNRVHDILNNKKKSN